MAFKINESIIVIQAEATSPNRTNVVFWSHDRGTAKLRMKLVRKNGIPQSLPEGTTVPIRLMFRSATAEGGYGKHDYLATIEDRVNGIVSIVLEDNILGYVGTVEGSVYIDLPNDRSLDTAGRFTFDIKRSPIDDSTPELEDYYFNGFSQTIDKIEKILADGKQEIEQKIAESETQIDAKVKDTNDKITKANQDVATLNTNIDKANDRIDQTNQQIGDLGKLKKMYSNSIDFGDYDYSGNPNLMPVLKAKDFSPNSQMTIEDSGNSLKVTFAVSEGAKFLTSIKNIPSLLPDTQYTLSADVTILEGYKGNLNSLRLTYRKTPGGTILLAATAKNAQVGKKTKIYAAANSSAATDPSTFDRMYFTIDTTSTEPFVGTVLVENIKVERGSTPTPYQPNLLDEPYWLGKAPLGENIADPTVKFPITSNSEGIYTKNALEDFVLGETYTVTIGATKPASQTIRVYLAQKQFSDFKPVEGLVDTWVATVSITQLGENAKGVYLFQTPNTSLGSCTIKWLKIEKGDTRTPNISQFKYFGEGLKDSNNPNDYIWDVTPEYTEKGLNNTVSLTEPETVLGLKNFKDGVQIDGVDVATVKNLGSVLQSGSGLTTIQSDKQSAFDEFSYEFERIGDRVFFHARVKTISTTAVASHVNLLEIPLGFQFPIGWTIVGVPLSVVQWTTPQGEISALVITDSTGKQVVKFATNRVGNHYISGEWRTADSYPETK
ncbi:BppU family phage baseplate upper protein [Enterococcus faecium]|uniref:BppU family phage baseplate upper protein n=1 Tax=Enterococcus faecium TaxID=1352 RepID=UPI002072A9C3|nr:BppU family phage baseplate upper protein [Enterococcus faecium]MCM6871247.1 BppU family phage baseplate upper protein [Enterococcus faecium]MCM6876848.1 BppU family phage baseplate upper protein [Enterococcus faecium]MCM6887871.1 BppU family phage baseplate upper protein [Enterococcus faecium]MCM6892038.1 BppU family phage baseplate upper protein [Enterococcus faecium]MCM6911421.1 BppU family phage baseplate upper protein [Enterococcus faecium]